MVAESPGFWNLLELANSMARDELSQTEQTALETVMKIFEETCAAMAIDQYCDEAVVLLDRITQATEGAPGASDKLEVLTQKNMRFLQKPPTGRQL